MTFIRSIQIILFLNFLSFQIIAQTPSYKLELRNDVQVSNTEYEFDIYMLRTGDTEFEYASGQYGILLNNLIVNGGTIEVTIIANSSDPSLVATGQNPTAISFFSYPGDIDVIRIGPTSIPNPGPGAIISAVLPGTRICRVRISNSVEFGQYQPNLTWTTNSYYPTQISAFVDGNPIAITNYEDNTNSNLVNPVLINVATSSGNYSDNDFEFRVYPNPFNEKTKINYTIFQNSQVILSVWNTEGKMVADLINTKQNAGVYSISWSPDILAEGTYYVILRIDQVQKALKVSLVR